MMASQTSNSQQAAPAAAAAAASSSSSATSEHPPAAAAAAAASSSSVPSEPAKAKKPSKEERKKTQEEAKKAQEEAQKKKREAEAAAAASAPPPLNEFFGVLPLNQSQSRSGRGYTAVVDLDEKKAQQEVLVRARVHSVRAAGNLCFVVLRQRLATVQVVISKGDTSKEMVVFCQRLHRESLVDVVGQVTLPKEPVLSCTQKHVELQGKRLHVVSASAVLPVQIEDLTRPQPVLDEQEAQIALHDAELQRIAAQLATASSPEEKRALEEKRVRVEQQRAEAAKFPNTSLEVRLNHRVIELRTQTNQAVFRLQAGVCALFREFLTHRGFVEIHTPKMIGAATEGGASVFELKYFNRAAYLAQSPQFYKQMMVCADFERVFEIGPVFRAEDSNTPRHLTEFTGLDLEMTISEHYHEVLDVMEEMFLFIFDGLRERYGRELDLVNLQYPFQPIEYKRPTLRLRFAEGIDMLLAAGSTTADHTKDINTPDEKLLGKLVKQKYGVDFYVLDQYPAAARPFYTMPNGADPRYSNSYDLFVRGEEIVSGSQRVHDAALLERRAREKGVDPAAIQPYIDAFRFGAPPHGGCGVGLERLLMLYLGIGNIRRTSLFPRDPSRLNP